MLNSQKRRANRYKEPKRCKVPHIYLKGVICGLPAGHDGDHQVIVKWKQESPPPLGINVTETVTVKDKFGG